MLVGSDASETTSTWSPDGTRTGYTEIGRDSSGTIRQRSMLVEL
jgi:hypothetical protein